MTTATSAIPNQRERQRRNLGLQRSGLLQIARVQRQQPCRQHTNPAPAERPPDDVDRHDAHERVERDDDTPGDDGLAKQQIAGIDAEQEPWWLRAEDRTIEWMTLRHRA